MRTLKLKTGDKIRCIKEYPPVGIKVGDVYMVECMLQQEGYYIKSIRDPGWNHNFVEKYFVLEEEEEII
jgi:hypothetical protein